MSVMNSKKVIKVLRRQVLQRSDVPDVGTIVGDFEMFIMRN